MANGAHTVARGPVREGESWARSAPARLGRLPGVHRAGLALTEGGGRRLLFTASDRGGNGEPEWCEVDVYEDVPLNHTIRTGDAVVGSMDDLAAHYGAFTGRQTSQTHALASIPVVSAGQVQGGFVLFFDSPQPFDRPQLSQLSDLGAQLGTALTVRDGGSAVVVDPRNVSTDRLAVHGRGLQLVDAISTRWGSELDAGGMTVWFVVEPVAEVVAESVPPTAAGLDGGR